MSMLLADTNHTYRLGVRSALGKEHTCVAIDEVETRTELMTRLQSRDYDLLMIDPMLAGGTGEGLIRQMRAIGPRANILVFMLLDESVYDPRIIRSGARAM